MSGQTTTRGFTLLEVILTLAMSVALMLLVGGAMRFYGLTMNVREMDIRQTQLASAVLQMIEDDLRATLFTRPISTAGLEALLAGGGQVESDADLSAAGIESDSPPETTSVDLFSTTTVLQSPGLIGNQFQIQVDLSRLPRLEEYVAMLDGTTSDLEDVPSDIKTVAYHVQAPATLGGVQDALQTLTPNETSAVTGGLVRRSLDRAVTVEAALSGGISRLNQTGDMIAPEIIAIEFAYWDGTTWLTAWDSDQYKELPLAIEVQLTLDDPIAAAANASQGSATSEAATRVFKHTIRLPLARPLDGTEQQDDLQEAGL